MIGNEMVTILRQVLTIVVIAAGSSALVLFFYWIASLILKKIKPPDSDNLIHVPKPNVTYGHKDEHKAKKPVR